MQGNQIWQASKNINSAEDSTIKAFSIGVPHNKLSEVYFLKLVLKENYFSLLGGESKTVSVLYLTDENPAGKKFKPTVTIEQLR